MMEDYDTDEGELEEEQPSRTNSPESIAEEQGETEAELEEEPEEGESEEEEEEEETRLILPGRDNFAVTDRPGYGRGDEDAIEEIFIVPDEKRRSSSVLSMFEFTELISVRAAQISKGGVNAAMIDIPDGISQSREIAILELMARRCPLKMMRHMGRDVLPNGKIKKYVEFWSPNDMTHPTI